MAKTTQIINHLENMDSDTAAIVGSTGQVQLIKKEDEMYDINEFYDTVEEAETEAEAWIAIEE
tara:strand:- start:111 stop:299 length:189 start_codon:yes stop_codon:yes gene_type:complete